MTQKLVRMQDKGQVTLPAEVRRKAGLKKGDVVAVVATDEGVLITPRAVLALKALDKVGEILREEGVTLEELIETGRAVRSKLVEKHYGIPADQQGD